MKMKLKKIQPHDAGIRQMLTSFEVTDLLASVGAKVARDATANSSGYEDGPIEYTVEPGVGTKVRSRVTVGTTNDGGAFIEADKGFLLKALNQNMGGSE